MNDRNTVFSIFGAFVSGLALGAAAVVLSDKDNRKMISNKVSDFKDNALEAGEDFSEKFNDKKNELKEKISDKGEELMGRGSKELSVRLEALEKSLRETRKSL